MRLVSWHGHNINDETNYRSSLEVGGHTPAGVEPGIVLREDGALVGGAVTAARYLVIRTTIPASGDKRALQAQWYGWFRPRSRRIAALVVEDDDGGNERFMDAMPIDVTHEADGDGWVLLTTMAVHDEPELKSVVEDSDSWSITASGQTKGITNGGARNGDAFPVYTITPGENKDGNQGLGVFCAARWRSNGTGVDYCYDIVNGGWNTAALVGAGKMQADGDDIRVVVDGVETDYWLSGMNSAATKVWTVLQFQPKREFTLTAGRSSGSTSDIVVTEDVAGMPGVGLLMIDSEIFSYTSVDTVARAFRGVSAGAKDSTAAGHSAGAAVVWIQRDILITYGNPAATAYPSNPARKPMFNLASSTNTSWVYEEFFEEGASRPGAWAFTVEWRGEKYGGNQMAAANPYGELGMKSVSAASTKDWTGMYWSLNNPCGIVSANFTSGEFYYNRTLDWNPRLSVYSSTNGAVKTESYLVPRSGANVWQAWSQNVTLVSGARFVYLWLQGWTNNATLLRGEASAVTLALDSSLTPTVALSGEASSGYQLRARLANVTTGEALDISFDMALGSSLEIDTDSLRVTYLEDGSRHYQAIMPDAPRDALLRLAPGANTLMWTDEGTTDVAVGVVWRKRWVN